MKAKSLIGCLLAFVIFGCIKFCGDNGVELNGSKTVVRTVKEKIFTTKAKKKQITPQGREIKLQSKRMSGS